MQLVSLNGLKYQINMCNLSVSRHRIKQKDWLIPRMHMEAVVYNNQAELSK